MKTGITGATGQLGQLIIEQLKTKGDTSNLVALVRTPSKAASLGLEVREFDYNSPETLDDALKGIDQLLLISGSEIGRRKAQHENVINAAKKAGVKWIVYTSLLHADTSSLILAAEHLATETLLKTSGIDYTILRNGWYTENYTASVPGALKNDTYIGSAGNGKISSAARKDYAAAAAAVLNDSKHISKTYELAGDNFYTLTDLAAELSNQTAKKIEYLNLAEAEYTAKLQEAGLPAPLAAAFASFDASAAKGDLFDDSKQLSALIGRATTPLKESIKAVLA